LLKSGREPLKAIGEGAPLIPAAQIEPKLGCYPAEPVGDAAEIRGAVSRRTDIQARHLWLAPTNPVKAPRFGITLFASAV
jgi:hypothetical protein